MSVFFCADGGGYRRRPLSLQSVAVIAAAFPFAFAVKRAADYGYIINAYTIYNIYEYIIAVKVVDIFGVRAYYERILNFGASYGNR